MRTRLIIALVATMALVGCGDDGGGGGNDTDAGPQVDASPTDPTPAGGTCGVIGSEPGTQVVFNAPDGSLLDWTAVDVDGNASSDLCVADTMITLVFADLILEGPGDAVGPLPAVFSHEFPMYSFVTITGIQPGDSIHVGDMDFDGIGYNNATMNTSSDFATAANVSADGVGWELRNGCVDEGGYPRVTTGWAPGDQVDVWTGDDCLGTDNMVDFLAVARNVDEEIIGYSTATGLEWMEGGLLADMTAWMDVPGPPPAVNVSLTNPPAMSSFVGAGFRQMRDEVGFVRGETFFIPGVDPVLTHVADPHPLAFFDAQESHAGAVFSGSPLIFGFEPNFVQFGYTFGVFSAAPAVGEFIIDMTAQLLPRLAGVFVTVDGDPTRPTVSWLADGAIDADAGMFAFLFGPAIPAGEPRGMWLVVTHAPGAGSFQLPEMPDNLQFFVPYLDDTLFPLFGSVVDYDWLDYLQVIQTMDPFVLFGLDEVMGGGGPGGFGFFSHNPYSPGDAPPTADYSRRRALWFFNDPFLID